MDAETDDRHGGARSGVPHLALLSCKGVLELLAVPLVLRAWR
jgi:hypothetical protein